jgi:molybdopterin-containing oxidoreductase family membrane subunit
MATGIAIETGGLRKGGWVVTEAFLLVLAVIGLGAWIYQVNSGLVITNMTNMVVWGLYITVFMFLVGLSAGGLIVASAGEIFGAKQLKPLAPLAIWLSFVCVGLAAASIIPDLGSPQRILLLFTSAQWSSPFIWDMTIILFYLILSFVYLWVHIRSNTEGEKAQKFKRWVRTLAFVALPSAILVHSITAWIFGLQIARSYWHSALMAPFFISSALVSGLALMILATLLSRRARVLHVQNELISWLGGLLATFLVVEFFFLVAELITRIYPGANGEISPVIELLSGRYAPLFWVEVVLGLAIPFFLLVVTSWRKAPSIVGLAAGLAIVGIFLKRFTLLLSAFTYPHEHFPPGIQTGQFLPSLTGLEYFQPTNASPFMKSVAYSPALAEVLIVIGLVSAGVLLFLVGLQLIPFNGLRVKNG